VRYETRTDAPEWSQAVKDVLAMEKPTAIVVMLGVNDRLPLRDHAPPHPGAATTSPQGQGAARANYRAEQNEHCAAGGNYRTEQNQAASWISRHHWLSITGEPMTYSKSFTRSREWVQLRNLEGASAASAVTLKADNRLRRSK
jgi:lysophospholipase L1-like esterase